jgi:hypothetical protein
MTSPRNVGDRSAPWFSRRRKGDPGSMSILLSLQDDMSWLSWLVPGSRPRIPHRRTHLRQPAREGSYSARRPPGIGISSLSYELNWM